MATPAPQLSNKTPGDPNAERLLSTVVKVGAAVAAFTGGIVGLSSFFNLGFEIVTPSLFAALLLILGYFVLTTKKRWSRVLSIVLLAIFGVVGSATYLALGSIFDTDLWETVGLLGLIATFAMFGYLGSTIKRRGMRAVSWSLAAILSILSIKVYLVIDKVLR